VEPRLRFPVRNLVDFRDIAWFYLHRLIFAVLDLQNITFSFRTGGSFAETHIRMRIKAAASLTTISLIHESKQIRADLGAIAAELASQTDWDFDVTVFIVQEAASAAMLGCGVLNNATTQFLEVFLLIALIQTATSDRFLHSTLRLFVFDRIQQIISYSWFVDFSRIFLVKNRFPLHITSSVSV
jgi:hypothetical protein